LKQNVDLVICISFTQNS